MLICLRSYDIFSQWSLSFCSRQNIFAFSKNILKCQKSKTFTLSEMIFVFLCENKFNHTNSLKWMKISKFPCRIRFNHTTQGFFLLICLCKISFEIFSRKHMLKLWIMVEAVSATNCFCLLCYSVKFFSCHLDQQCSVFVFLFFFVNAVPRTTTKKNKQILLVTFF